MSAYSFIVTGPEGVGKVEAIRLLSDEFHSSASASDDLSCGHVSLGIGQSFNIYVTTGQERSRDQWEDVAEHSLGLVILLDNDRPDPISDLSISVQNFAELIQRTAFVVGVKNLEKNGHFFLNDYRTFLKYIDLCAPVIEVNPDEKRDIAALMDVLMAELEYTPAAYSKA